MNKSIEKKRERAEKAAAELIAAERRQKLHDVTRAIVKSLVAKDEAIALSHANDLVALLTAGK